MNNNIINKKNIALAAVCISDAYRNKIKIMFEFKNYLNENIETHIYDDKNECEELEDLILLNAIAFTKTEHTRIKDFIPRVVKNYTSLEFQQNFRLTWNAFDFLHGKVCQKLNENIKSTGRPTIPIEKQLYAVIWLLVNQECYR